MSAASMDQLVALCKRRGFIYQNAQIYGGLQGFYDFGPLGVELKNNLKDCWWKSIVHGTLKVYGLDTSIITHRQILKQSGHEDTFSDPMVDCRSCKARHRADHIDKNCTNCDSDDLTEPRPFHLMFKTQIGPVADDSSLAYLRPETAQGIFVNFKNIVDSFSPKLPFGIAQMGKAFRNEITPRNFIFRVREFEQMELEFFVDPSEDDKWYEYWVQERQNWWEAQGISKENMKLEIAEEPAHYAKATTDILYKFPHGFEELEGIANRTDFDLGSHTKAQEELNVQSNVLPNKDSTAKLSIQNLDNKTTVPFVIEPSAGVERGFLAIINEAFHIEKLENGQERCVLKLKPHLAPIKAAVIPLAKNKPKMIEYVDKIALMLSKASIGKIEVEKIGNIGKAYRRHDEIGTPCCITVDFDTIGADDSDAKLHDTVTIRDRDSLQQTRVPISQLVNFLRDSYSQV